MNNLGPAATGNMIRRMSNRDTTSRSAGPAAQITATSQRWSITSFAAEDVGIVDHPPQASVSCSCSRSKGQFSRILFSEVGRKDRMSCTGRLYSGSPKWLAAEVFG